MSAEFLPGFFSSAGASHTMEAEDAWLSRLVSDKIYEVRANDTSSNPGWVVDPGCSLANMQNFLLKASIMLAQLARALVHSDEINIYCRSKVQKAVSENSLFDFKQEAYLSRKERYLKYVSCITVSKMTSIHTLKST